MSHGSFMENDGADWTLLTCSADHVDILGASPLNAAILKIAAGRGDLVENQIESGILDYVEKMKWD